MSQDSFHDQYLSEMKKYFCSLEISKFLILLHN